MKVLDAIKKYLNDPACDCFSLSVEKQKHILYSIPEPKDDFDRSYYQYLCQMKLAGKSFSFRSNIISFFLFWAMMIFLPWTRCVKSEFSNNAVFVAPEGNLKCIPESLANRFDKIINFRAGMKLSLKDRKFALGLFLRHPFSYYFLAKILFKVASYRLQISYFSPRSIITTSEYSFTSSALTEYCHQNGLEHINVMHGEKLFYIRDSFYHFDRCYVWEEFYANLGKLLRAEDAQFVVERPLAQQPWPVSQISKSVDYTYYLQAESKGDLAKIRDSMLLLKQKGNVVSIRPHPLYSDMEYIKELFSDFVLEAIDEIKIEESVLRTRNAVSLYSSVLTQAFNNGVSVVIDDITNKQHYENLAELQFCCLNRKHILLSNLVNAAASTRKDK